MATNEVNGGETLLAQKFWKLAFGGLLLPLSNILAAQTVPANPFDYSRSISYEYDAKGNLKKKTAEPDNPQVCSSTSIVYDSFGNVARSTVAGCAGATGRAVIAVRSESMSFPKLEQSVDVNGSLVTISVPAGVLPSSAANALGHVTSSQADPRFGTAVKVTDPNGMSETKDLDAFGRVARTTASDGTSVVFIYCILSVTGLDTSTNSPGCPTPVTGEAPADAIAFAQQEARSTTDAKNGPFQRTYKDRLGRVIRTVTEGYDGVSQPSNVGALVVQDVVYSTSGAKTLETKPYFLATGGTGTQESTVGVTQYQYDELGRVVTTLVADSRGQAGANVFGGTGTVAYGRYGSVPAAASQAVYSGTKTIVINDRGQQKTTEASADGFAGRITDNYGAQVAFQQDAFGNVLKTVDALQNEITSVYNIAGKKVSGKDPDKGTWKYDFDALSQQVWAQSPNQLADGTATITTYDLLGRPVSRSEAEFTTTWTYDQYADGSACTKGQMCEVTTSSGLRRRHYFDEIGRPASTRVDIASDNKSFATSQTYNTTTGRPTYFYYPTGARVANLYTVKGFLKGVALYTSLTVNPLPDSVGGTPSPSTTIPSATYLWEKKVADAAGRSEQEFYYGGLTRQEAFSPLDGRASAFTVGAGDATAVLDHAYSWDSVGNLTGRTDNNGDGSAAVSETFAYDALNRLTSYTVASPSIPSFARKVQLRYNALGMLLNKTDVGSYAYGSSGPTALRPHAVQSITGAAANAFTYDANGNVVTASGGKYRSFDYTTFDLPSGNAGVAGPAGGPVYAWQYDHAHARIKETRTIEGTGVRTTWMMHPDALGGLFFESEKNEPTTPSADNPALTTNRHYVNAGGETLGYFTTLGEVPPLASTQTAPTALASATSNKLELWHKDHLGSLVATSDHQGIVTGRYSYDPYGKRREPDGVYDADGVVEEDESSAVNHGIGRGFTGHEHLDDVGIVHMNGRLFDPTLGLFLQGDPLVGDAANLQSYNRYAYVSNNPLNSTDPSGFDKLPVYDGDARTDRTMRTVYTNPEAVVNNMAMGGKLSIDRPTSDGRGRETVTVWSVSELAAVVEQYTQRFSLINLARSAGALYNGFNKGDFRGGDDNLKADYAFGASLRELVGFGQNWFFNTPEEGLEHTTGKDVVFMAAGFALPEEKLLKLGKRLEAFYGPWIRTIMDLKTGDRLAEAGSQAIHIGLDLPMVEGKIVGRGVAGNVREYGGGTYSLIPSDLQYHYAEHLNINTGNMVGDMICAACIANSARGGTNLVHLDGANTLGGILRVHLNARNVDPFYYAMSGMMDHKYRLQGTTFFLREGTVLRGPMK